jgi:hypothetical protein
VTRLPSRDPPFRDLSVRRVAVSAAVFDTVSAILVVADTDRIRRTAV